MPAPKPTPSTGPFVPQFKLRTVILTALGTLVAAAVVAGIAYYAGLNRQ
jgi:hypothetical protein